MDAAHLALVGGAAVGGGLVNAIAGGGSLVTFPALVACGVPALVANVTNTVALCPGYLGATVAQRRDLAGQGRRAAFVLPAAIAGGIAGALLLLGTGESAFEKIVPFLLVLAAGLVAMQDRVRRWVIPAGRAEPAPLHSGAREGHAQRDAWAALPVAIAAVYGGYFGAGMSVIVLDDSLVRVNALKQTVALGVNVAAAVVFAIAAHVDWIVALVMMIGSLAGGVLGGAVASRVSAKLLRAAVIATALAVAAVYFARL